MRAWHRPARALVGAVVVGTFFTAVVLDVQAQEIGRLIYLEGDVQLVRDGTIRDAFSIDPGETLLPLDVVQTGFDGYAEVELTSPASATVRIRENSAYYVEPAGSNGNRRTVVRLLNGRLEASVSQLRGGDRLEVHTQGAVLGVRGTEFDVIIAPDEAVLFGVRDGTVAISAAGRQVAAQGGVAVETEGGGQPSRRIVPDGAFDRFYDRWVELRLQAFRSGAPTFIRAYARRYQDTLPTFQDAFTQLSELRQRLQEAAEAEGSSLGGDMRLRAEISPAVIRMRSILPIFENTVYRLRELRRFHDQGIGRTQVGQTPSEEFFRRFAAQEDDLMRRLSEVRAIFRLYRRIEERSFGGLPGGSDDGPFGGRESLLDSMRF